VRKKSIRKYSALTNKAFLPTLGMAAAGAAEAGAAAGGGAIAATDSVVPEEVGAVEVVVPDPPRHLLPSFS
jgi:hypothetical protein